MALLAAAGSVVSGLFGLASGVYQSNVAKMNAQIAEENAQRAVVRGNAAAAEQDTLTKAALGEQLSVQAASGLSTGSKSQILTRKAARALGRQDSINVKEAANTEAYNYQTQAANFKAEGTGALLGGAGSLVGGFLQAGSVIGDARSVRRRSYKYSPNPTPRPTSLVS